jgi:hypothetical protein
MDLPQEVEENLRREGYTVETGDFGMAQEVNRTDTLLPVPVANRPASVTEQEIVVVDLAADPPLDYNVPAPNEGEAAFFQNAANGAINPRPVMMNSLRVQAFDRILEHGGVFVVFLDEPASVDYVLAKVRYQHLADEEHLKLSTWDLLTLLNRIEAKRDSGTEYKLTDLGEKIPGVRQAMKGSGFRCTVSQGQLYERNWMPLARNKYDEVISAILSPSEEGSGVVFLFPRVTNKSRLILDLLTEFIPRVAPDLFPHIQRSDWVREPPYELPEIQALEQEAAAVEAKADARVKALEGTIADKRAERSYLYELLTAGDEDLVAAVKQTLEMLGFQNIIDVDGEADDQAPLREDLQILDRSPVLLVEVKGIAGLPKENYALQVDKYVAPRMREWERTDIQGLTIINHQLQKPGLDRQRDHVFQDDVITNAHARKIGLLTTWELYRLARSYLKNDWQPEHVVDLFYSAGVIEPIPTHYEPVGTINNFYEQAGAVTIELVGAVAVGDKLAYDLPVEFTEEPIISMQLNDQQVEQADPGQEIGLVTGLSKDQARKGVRVFRVA